MKNIFYDSTFSVCNSTFLKTLTKKCYFYMEVPGDGLGVSLFLIIEAKISDSLFPNIVKLFIKLTRYI